MERIECQTRLGPVWLWGSVTGRPVLLVITGAGAEATTMDHFGAVFPALDVLRTHLPGNNCPPLAEVSVEAFASALDGALEPISAPVAVLGLSVGALVALGLRRPLAGLLLVEPPLRTENLWPIAVGMRGEPEFMAGIFGIEAGAISKPRDYLPLLDQIHCPCEVLIGDVPVLPVRVLNSLASLVDDTARAALSSHPGLSVTVAPNTGHHVPKEATDLFEAATRRLVGRLSPCG